MPPAITVSWRTDIDTGAVVADAGRAVYAIGDIHGCYDLAVALLRGVTADLATLPAGSRPLILFVGDYVDRGPQSAKILSMLVWMRRHAPCDVVCLLGNHEAMMLRFIDDPHDAIGWLEHGGADTLRSYGVDVDAELQAEGLRDALLDRMPASHLALLHELPLRATSGDYGFVHAGVRPNVAFARQSEHDCLWIRDEFLTATTPFDVMVVHGHTWQSATPTLAANRIGIDTGAYRTGVLTAAELCASDVRFLQATATVW